MINEAGAKLLAHHLEMIRRRVLSGETIGLKIRASVVGLPSIYVCERDVDGLETSIDAPLPTAADDDSLNGVLNEKQAERFVDLLMDEAVLLPDVRISCMLCGRDTTSRFRRAIHWFACWKKQPAGPITIRRPK